MDFTIYKDMDIDPRKAKQLICRNWVGNLGFCELVDCPLDLVDKERKTNDVCKRKMSLDFV